MNKNSLLPYIIDGFAGGGGASVGIEMALGRPVNIAINHDPQAILMHQTNHPGTTHFTEDIFKVDLQKHIQGRHVALMWMSPDCTSHSRAKGGQPRNTGLRILPWAVYKHTKDILPDVIIMENVEEIQLWGPLDENGIPIKERQGEEYRKFIASMKSLGYDFDCKELVAADYGAPTIRKRWYAIFRRDGRPIVWPEPTHSKTGENGLKKWVPAHTVLDFTNLGKSIFGRKKPLAEKTLQRIANGLKKFVIECDSPFTYGIKDNITAPYIDKAYGGNYSGGGSSVDSPLHTITTVDHNRLVSPVLIPCNSEVSSFITKFYKSGTGQSMLEPLHTITTSAGHFGQVSVLAAKKEDLLKSGVDKEIAEKCTMVSHFIMEYYGCGTGQSVNDPLHTIVTKERFALITVFIGKDGSEYVLLDIYLRMLTADELKRAQGFPEDYIIDRDYNWRVYPVVERVKRIGNSVVPIMAKVLVEANCYYLKMGDRVPNLIVDDSEQQLKFA